MELMNIFPLIIHVTFLTMVCNYVSCLVQHRHEQKFNPEWFFLPAISWADIKRVLKSDISTAPNV